jgi:acyl transferase domain-containing protein/acyl carrier protein
MKLERSKQDIVLWMKNYFSNLLQVPSNAIKIHSPFFDLGASSFDLIQFANDLSVWSDLPIEVSDLFNYPNIDKLAYYLSHFESSKMTNVKTAEFSLEPIAIIGMACDFPGASNIDHFWEMMVNGKSGIRKLDRKHFDQELSFDAYAGIVDDFNHFDNDLFEISKEELRYLDPQQKILLTLAWRAIENARMSPLNLKNSSTGVFVGISTNDHSLERARKQDKVTIYDGTGAAHSISANRISYYFDFKGPSLAVDTACSSSLLAIHLAANSLRMNECEMAMAFGVNAILSPLLLESFNKAGMLSRTGSCKSFSDGADGYVRSEGAGALVLKKLSKAQADGDFIWATIKGSHINQDGRTNTITAPNGLSQERVILNALSNANLNANDIDFIEAHGTGTILGDPIEYKALSGLFKNNDRPVYISSVKTNIGHLEACAGMAGSIKAILALKNRCFPKLINFKSINKNITTDSDKLKLALENIYWKKDLKSKKIGVSSFGFGGTNAHIIFEEYLEEQTIKNLDIESQLPTQLFVFSSTTEKALDQTLESFELYLGSHSKINISDLALSLVCSRSKLNKSTFYLANNVDELRLKLATRESLKIKEIDNLKNLAFSFTGQGSQFVSMGVDYYNYFPVFREHFNYICQEFSKLFNVNIFEIWKNKESPLIYRTDYGQALLFAFEYSMFKLLEEVGVYPDYLFGHSLGEMIAVICAEFITLDEGIKLVYLRGKSMQKAPAGRMLTVELNAEELDRILGDDLKLIDIASRNTLNSLVLSGDIESIEKVVSVLKEKKIVFTLLKVEQAFHSRQMKKVALEFEKDISGIKYQKSKFKVLSCHLKREILLEDLNPAYWCKHLVDETNFISVCEEFEKNGSGMVVEIGPHMILARYLYENINKEIHVCPVSIKNQNEIEVFLKLIATLYLCDIEINWGSLYQNRNTSIIQIPYTCLSYSELNSDNLMTSTNTISNEFELRKLILSIISEVLLLSENEVHLLNFDLDFIQLGADSLSLLSFIDSLNEKLNIHLQVVDVLQKYNTLNKILTHILDLKKIKSNKVQTNSDATIERHYSKLDIQKLYQTNTGIFLFDDFIVDINKIVSIDNLNKKLVLLFSKFDSFYVHYDRDLDDIVFNETPNYKVNIIDCSEKENANSFFANWYSDYQVTGKDGNTFSFLAHTFVFDKKIRFYIRYNRAFFNASFICQFLELIRNSLEQDNLLSEKTALRNLEKQFSIKGDKRLLSSAISLELRKATRHYIKINLEDYFNLQNNQIDRLPLGRALNNKIVSILHSIISIPLEHIAVVTPSASIGSLATFTVISNSKTIELKDIQILFNEQIHFYKNDFINGSTIIFETKIEKNLIPVEISFFVIEKEIILQVDIQDEFLNEDKIKELFIQINKIRTV